MYTSHAHKFRGHFGAIFWKNKSMGYSLGYFSNLGYFFKMAITQKIEVGISSNLLRSIFISICIRKCNKIFW